LLSMSECRTTGEPRSRFLYYGLALLQALVLAGYFLPWYQDTDGMLMKVYSDLTHISSEMAKELGVLLIACFVVMAVSLALTSYVVVSNRRRTQVLRVSSLLTSLALAGPLIYLQSLLQFRPEWFDLSDRLGHMGLGWFLVLLLCVGATLLALYMFKQTFGAPEQASIPAQRLTGGSNRASYHVILMVLFASGIVIAVVGYFQTWSSGTFFTIFGTTTLSKSGVDEAPLMCLVLSATVLALALFLLDQLTRCGSGQVFLLAAQSVLVVGLTLTVFWGVILGDYELTYRGLFGRATLQPGWYMCLSGQVLALICLVLVERVQPPRSP